MGVEIAARKKHTWSVLPQPLPLGSGGILTCSSHPPTESLDWRRKRRRPGGNLEGALQGTRK